MEYELTDTYLQKEQELINCYEPIFNKNMVYTGLTEKEYQKQYSMQWRESHKDYDKQYKNQKCNYNGEILTLGALATRFRRQGIKHSTKEAKKHLIQ